MTISGRRSCLCFIFLQSITTIFILLSFLCVQSLNFPDESSSHCAQGLAKKALYSRLSDVRLAPQVLPVAVTTTTHQHEMPERPRWSGSQSRMGLVSLSLKREEDGREEAHHRHRSRGDGQTWRMLPRKSRRARPPVLEAEACGAQLQAGN